MDKTGSSFGVSKGHALPSPRIGTLGSSGSFGEKDGGLNALTNNGVRLLV